MDKIKIIERQITLNFNVHRLSNCVRYMSPELILPYNFFLLINAVLNCARFVFYWATQDFENKYISANISQKTFSCASTVIWFVRQKNWLGSTKDVQERTVNWTLILWTSDVQIDLHSGRISCSQVEPKTRTDPKLDFKNCLKVFGNLW